MLKITRLFFITAALLVALSASAQVRITEFMASNTSTLADEDGDFSDWIEIQNTSPTNVNLLNWSLTDSASHPAEWLFPATNLASGNFMVIFASGKNRAVAGQELHTNFKLSSGGEYLALVKPDGSIVTQFSPEFPPQFPDVSYGVGMQIVSTTLVASNAPLRYVIPTDASADATWTQTNFSDGGWPAGINGVGYDTGIADPLETTFAGNVLNTAPAAYWRLNETSGPNALNLGTDGLGAQGGYLGSIVYGQPGPCPPQFTVFESNNVAPTFNGTNTYVNGPYQYLSQVTGFTVAGWIYPTGTQKNRTGLFGQNNVVEFGFSVPGNIHLYTTKGSLDYAYPFANNTWHYLAAVGSTNQIAIYADGNLVASKSVSGATFGDAAYFFNIGGGGIVDATTNWFLGQIDEVAVWKRALSASEMTSLVSTNNGQLDYTPYISTDVQSQMYHSNTTAYLRIPFTVDNPAAFSNLKLLMRYDAGFVAYLNGQKILFTNAPASPAWNSAATAAHANALAVNWQTFDVSGARQYLQAGNNVLAIQGLDGSTNSVHFLVQAQLVAQGESSTETAMRYFVQPTPGGPNGIVSEDLGPIISGASHFPNVPQTTDSLTVTAQVAQAFNTISNVALNYRVMFGTEVPVTMNDSGTNGDVVAGDGIWSGQIPAGVATAGQMIRYYVTATDTVGNTSRWPLFPSATDSQQYFGTVVADPTIQTLLPVAYLFVQDTNAIDTQNGGQVSLFYLNELYDNVNMSIHGQSSANWAKKSHNLDFPEDHQFLYQPGGVRESHVVFMTDYSDKARMRTTLTYAIAAQAGGAAFFSFPIRIHLNGSFWEIEDMVEKGDENFLTRIGRDPNGALYKMYNALSSASGNEKETRKSEGTADLNTLITNLVETLPLATRVTYGYDNLDLPQTADYFATMAIASSQDLGHKNYYLYRDTEGTGEWAIFPWDLDLTWGRDWVSSFTGTNYFNDVSFTTNVLSFYPSASIQSKPANRLFDLFFNSPDFRQMYLRRLRTLADTILMPPGTPTNALVIEPRIRQYEAGLNPPTISPSDTALDNAAWGPTWGDTSLSVFPNDAERLISTYLAGRRTYLYTDPNATLNGDPMPAAQPTNAALTIASWDFNPVSGNSSEQFVQLANTNSYAVDISDWKIIGGISFTFASGTVVPAGESIYISASVNAFRARAASPHGGQNLFVQGPFSGFLSAQGNSPLILENANGARVSANGFAGNSLSTQLIAGNLAVLRVGDGAETLGSQGNSVFIDQFTTNGTLVSTITIPDNDVTNALLVSGSASSEGALTRSPDGRLLLFAGYQIPLTNAATLSMSLANLDSVTVPRAVGVLDTSGAFAIVGMTTNQFSGNNMRSGTTDGRGNYWGAGGVGGTFYFGGGATNTVQTNVANTIVLQDLGGDLYFSTQKTTNGIWKISGTPTISASANLLISAGSKASSYAFAFNPNFTTAYIADDTTKGVGGIQRWDFNGTTWAMSYAFSGITNVGARGVAVDFSGANPVIYATTAEATANRLVCFTDTNKTAAVTTLATSGVNQLFRGVAFTPDANIVPQFFNSAQNTNGFAITWTAVLNQNYSVQYNNDLTTTNWVTFTNLTATLPTMTVTDTGAPLTANRFYRVVLNP
jgi:hypothetical protein